MSEQRIGGEELRLALDHVPAYVSIKDEDGRYRYANRLALDLLACTEDELGDLRDEDRFTADTIERLREIEHRVLDGGQVRDEVVVESLDGSRRVYWQVMTPLAHQDGQDSRTWVLGIATDITGYKDLEQQLSRAALVDQLTDLPNRRRFLERLEEALIRSDRTRSHGCVLFLDVDGLKIVNDRYGHVVGDRLLTSVGQRLRSLLRRNDTVARLGGDEFVVLAEDLGTEEDAAEQAAAVVAGKVHRAVCTDYDLGGLRLTGTASVGMTLFLGMDRTIDEVLTDADARMYAAKRARR